VCCASIPSNASEFLNVSSVQLQVKHQLAPPVTSALLFCFCILSPVSCSR
jgi:hypothetical protein